MRWKMDRQEKNKICLYRIPVTYPQMVEYGYKEKVADNLFLIAVEQRAG